MSSQPGEIERFLAPFPSSVRRTAETARRLVKKAVPEAIERLYPGWRLIGYRVPVGKASRYFGFVQPQDAAVVIGLEYGVFLSDRFPWLEGGGSQVRTVTLPAGEAIARAKTLLALLRAGADLARPTHGGRLAGL